MYVYLVRHHIQWKIALILTPQVHCNLEMIEANGILLWEKEIYSIEIAGIVTIPAMPYHYEIR